MGSKEKVKLPAPRGPSEVVADSKILEALSETKEEAGEDTAVEDMESQGYQDSGRGSDQSRKSSE